MARLHQITCFVFVLLITQVLASMRRDLRILSRMLPGEYSNLKQYHNDAISSNAVPTKERHIYIRSRYTPIQLPALDSDTVNFFVEHFMDNTGRPSQQKVYSFVLDPTRNSIRMEVYKLENIGDIKKSRVSRSKLHNISTTELYRHRECDMFWRRLGMRTFAAATGHQCVAYMKGEQVKILVSIVLTPTYINTQEGWYRLADQSTVTETGVPYKLIKVKKIKQKLFFVPRRRLTLNRGRRSRLRFGRSRRPQKDSPDLTNVYIGPWELRDLVSLEGALTSGHSVRYTVNLTNCFLMSGGGIDRLSFGDYVNTYEIYKDLVTQEITQLEFSHRKLIHGDHGFMSILKEIIVHSNSTVIVTVTYLLPASNHVFKQGQWYCRLYDFAQKDGSLKFITEPHKNVMPIKKFSSLLSLLQKGRLVRMSVDYNICAGARTKAISGGEITDYDVMESEKFLEVSMSRQLTSYRGYHKFVLNFVTFVFHSNGNVLVRATTMDSLTYMPYTSSKMHCNFGTMDDKGSVRLFYQ